MHGLPRYLVSDRDFQFTADFFCVSYSNHLKHGFKVVNRWLDRSPATYQRYSSRWRQLVCEMKWLLADRLNLPSTIWCMCQQQIQRSVWMACFIHVFSLSLSRLSRTQWVGTLSSKKTFYISLISRQRYIGREAAKAELYKVILQCIVKVLQPTA